MKKFLLTGIMAIVFANMFAQQIPLYSQYHYAQFLYNPALTGMYKRPQMYLLHRIQWTQMPGGPTTSAATFESALNKDKVGLGGIIYNDALGISNFIGGNFSYAYRIKMSEESNIALGLSAGINRLGIDFSQMDIINPFDPAVSTFTSNAKRTTFEGSGGANYSWKTLNVGFAIPNLLASRAKFFNADQLKSSNTYYQYARHFLMNASYGFNFKNGMTLTPIALFKAAPGFKSPQIDLNAILNVKDKYWGGLAYRSAWGITASAGVKLFDALTAGYAYDIQTNKAWKGQNFAGSTHEFIVGYSFLKDKEKLEKKVEKLDTAVQDNNKKVQEMDSALNEAKKKMDKMENDLKKRDDDNFENLKKEMDKMKDDIEGLRKKVAGGTYQLNRIYFRTDRSDLLPGSVTELDELVETLNKFPNMKIRIIGHTDSRNSEKYNMNLSERRVKSVYDYLVSKGISKDRLEYVGYGKMYPIADNNTETGMQLNRRVEFKVISF